MALFQPFQGCRFSGDAESVNVVRLFLPAYSVVPPLC